MLAVSALMTAANTMAAALSPSACRTPSRNPCMVRVEQTRYRNDPYNFRVLPPSPVSAQAIAAATPVPQQYAAVPAPRKHHQQYAAVAPVAPAAVVAPSPIKVQATTATPAPVPQMKKGPTTRFAVVSFKHEDRTFVAPFKIAAGDIVVVDGDRGENIGTVAEITTAQPSFAVSNKVVRKATPNDLEQLALQREKEAEAVKTCQTAVESLRLRATVVDCEFQFDLNKLTIFVERPSRKTFVDFRKLQRGLFRDFRCRIWLSYMDEVEEARAQPRFQ